MPSKVNTDTKISASIRWDWIGKPYAHFTQNADSQFMTVLNEIIAQYFWMGDCACILHKPQQNALTSNYRNIVTFPWWPFNKIHSISCYEIYLKCMILRNLYLWDCYISAWLGLDWKFSKFKSMHRLCRFFSKIIYRLLMLRLFHGECLVLWINSLM